MTNIIVTTPEHLRAIVREEVQQAVAAATAKRLLTATDLAAELECSVATIYRMEKDGRLPRRIGGYWTRDALNKWHQDRAHA